MSEENKVSLELFKRSFLAGVSIALGGYAYLAVGGFVGGLLFSFGLLSVYIYHLFLFTGLAGRIPYTVLDHCGLLSVLLGNITGAIVIALLARLSPLPVQSAAEGIFLSRIGLGWWKAGLLAILCGYIVEEAVYAAHQGTLWPTFFGVTVFVLCGFPHCIADAFYYALTPLDTLRAHAGELFAVYGAIVLGNYIGCNIRRIFGIYEEE